MNENYVEMMAAEDTKNQGQAENFVADPGMDVQVEHNVRGWKSAVRKGVGRSDPYDSDERICRCEE